MIGRRRDQCGVGYFFIEINGGIIIQIIHFFEPQVPDAWDSIKNQFSVIANGYRVKVQYLTCCKKIIRFNGRARLRTGRLGAVHCHVQ